jgi:hypothetical protein
MDYVFIASAYKYINNMMKRGRLASLGMCSRVPRILENSEAAGVA